MSSYIVRHEDKADRLLRAASQSTAVDFKTTAPYYFSPVGFSRIGFADIPVVGCRVFTKSIDAVVPVVRQHIMRRCAELAKLVDSSALDLTLHIKEMGFRRRVDDENEESASHGKVKVLPGWDCWLEINRPDAVQGFEDTFTRIYL